MAQVVTYATAALHQLYLLFVDAQNGTIAVGIAVQSDDKAVRQRCHLEIIADACHGTTGRNNVAEMIQQVEHLLSRHRVLIFLLDAGNLVGDAPMHLLGRLLVDVAERILHGILVHPHASCQLVAAEIS